MRTKTLLYTALAALTLSACADGNDLTADYTNTMNNNTAAEQPIEFGTYVGKSGATRSGQTAATGSIANDATLQAATRGFGVFAYYTGNENYDTNSHTDVGTTFGFTGNTTHKANFMFNERVFYSTDHWEYWPLKFWPNDNTTADNKGATGTTSSKVSFFAYAPYDGNDDDAGFGGGTDKSGAASGNTTGITKIYTSTTVAQGATIREAGDPLVEYKLADDGKQVDLLWGTANSIYNSAAGPATQDRTSAAFKTFWYKDAIPTWDRSVYPLNIDLTKPWVTTGTGTNTDKITFHFKHALAKVGGSLQTGETQNFTVSHGLQVQLDIDNNGTIKGGDKPAQTKVTIKTIKIENDNNMDMDGISGVEEDEKVVDGGVFNLATGRWKPNTTYDVNLKHTIVSQGSTLSEIAEKNADIATSLAEPASLDDGTAAWDDLVAGVLTYAQNVYETETDPLVFIPQTTPAFKVTVEYVVRTRDAKLAKGYSEVTQKISKYVQFASPVEVNKRYNLIMHLGLTSVKFTATVDNYETDINNNGTPLDTTDDYEEKTDVNLPINVTPAP